jgi:hypothetical protein
MGLIPTPTGVKVCSPGRTREADRTSGGTLGMWSSISWCATPSGVEAVGRRGCPPPPLTGWRRMEGRSLPQDDPPAPVGSGVILGYTPPPLAGWKNDTHKDGVRSDGQVRVAWPLAVAWRGPWLFARIAGRWSIARQFIAANHEDHTHIPEPPKGAAEPPALVVRPGHNRRPPQTGEAGEGRR